MYPDDFQCLLVAAILVVSFSGAVAAQDGAPVRTTPDTGQAAPKAQGLPEERQPWKKQFAFYEKTVLGALVPITNEAAFVDVRSTIVMKRIGSEPKTLERAHLVRACHDRVALTCRDGPEDDSCRARLRDCFDAGVVVDILLYRAPVETGKQSASCLADMLALSGLNARSRKLVRRAGGKACPEVFSTMMSAESIGAGESFTQAPTDWRHGDFVQISVYGRELGVVERVDTDSCAGAACKASRVRVLGSPFDRSFRVVDFSKMSVTQGGLGEVGPDKRSDLARAVRVSFSPDDPWRGAVARWAESKLALQVKAVAGSETRDVPARSAGAASWYIEAGELRDGENAAVTVLRRVRTADGAETTYPVYETHFEAAGIGPRYAPTGDYQAYVSTASTFVVLPAGKEPSYGFAQTLAYSFYWKSRLPGWRDHVALGFHVAAVAEKEEGKGEEEGEEGREPASASLGLGLGGQVTLGRDVVHLGGGYDIISKTGYLLIGLSLPDLAKVTGLAGSGS